MSGVHSRTKGTRLSTIVRGIGEGFQGPGTAGTAVAAAEAAAGAAADTTGCGILLTCWVWDLLMCRRPTEGLLEVVGRIKVGGTTRVQGQHRRFPSRPEDLQSQPIPRKVRLRRAAVARPEGMTTRLVDVRLGLLFGLIGPVWGPIGRGRRARCAVRFALYRPSLEQQGARCPRGYGGLATCCLRWQT